MSIKKSLFAGVSILAVSGLFAAGGSIADKPSGFRFFNQKLTIKPYLSLSYTYDSNIDTSKHAEDDNIFMVSPGVDFEWKGDRWSLAGGVWYRYSAYCDYSDQMGEDSYGQSLKYAWTTSEQNEKGWSLVLAERYAFISQSDGLNSNMGRGIWRDREAVNVSGALQRRFTERWHASLSGQYDWLNYKNETGNYAPLYGWSQYSGGLEFGYAASAWTDILVAGGYSSYKHNQSTGYHHYSNDSDSWTVQAGLGTHATKNITYRVLMGASWLSYGGQNNVDSGWTYSLSSNWRLHRQWQWSMSGQSYYQPSDRTLGQSIKVYALSTGVSYLTLADKLRLAFDVAFRYEETAYNDDLVAWGMDYDETIVSARLSANYTLNRWVSLFANIVWEDNSSDNMYWEYDRVRGTLGVRFHY
jgi:hypothetical protein